MVLRSSAAQYTRHHGEDDPEEAATGILEDTAAVPPTYPRESRSNSLVNANSISLTETGGGNAAAVASGASADTMSVSSDRLCAASEGHVRFVNSTIRYQMAAGGPGVWQSRNSLEKKLIVGLVTLAFVCGTLMLVIMAMTGQINQLHLHMDGGDSVQQAGGEDEFCLTPECVKVAGSILSSLDHRDQVHPCDDFYQYACGGFERLNPIPDGHSNWSMFEKLWEQNQLAMKNALEGLNVRKGRGTRTYSAEDKARLYYDSCIDAPGHIESAAGRPLIDLIRNYTGSWSLLDPPPSLTADSNSVPAAAAAIATDDYKTFNETTLQMRMEIFHNKLQSGGFFTWSVGENDKNSTQHVIHVDQGGLTLPTRDYYLSNDTTVMDALKKVMKKAIKLLIRDNQVQTNSSETISFDDIDDKDWDSGIEKQVNDIVELEKRIANFTIPAANRGEEGALYHKIKLNDLNTAADFLNWTTYFANAFTSVNEPIDGDTEVVVHASLYLANMTVLIREYMNTTEGKRTLNNYMTWHLVKTLKNSLSKEYRDASKGLEKALLGKETRQERWRDCVTDTDSALGFALGALFIRDTFSGRSKSVAQKMIARVKNAFIERLKHLNWMDSETSQGAIKKAKAITDMIGYPEYILNDKVQLDKKYEDLHIDGKTSYFENVLRNRAFVLSEEMKKLSKPVNRTKWGMTPPAVNAYYTPTKNQIVFPAGILQSPFFNVDYPNSLNFGAMGVVMGHELSHAFDNSGREYDEDGNLRDWWNNATLSKFKNLTECFVDQYSKYEILKTGGWKKLDKQGDKVGANVEAVVSGKQTLGENIADNGGLRAAYHAYKAWQHEKLHPDRHQMADEEDFKRELPLPGLQHLSNDQLFFISFSQVWCSKYTPQASKLQTLEDSHSPAKFRVIGVLSNSKEFSAAFGCPKGSPMNPIQKCEVW